VKNRTVCEAIAGGRVPLDIRNPPPWLLRLWAREVWGWSNRQWRRTPLSVIRARWRETAGPDRDPRRHPMVGDKLRLLSVHSACHEIVVTGFEGDEVLFLWTWVSARGYLKSSYHMRRSDFLQWMSKSVVARVSTSVRAPWRSPFRRR